MGKTLLSRGTEASPSSNSSSSSSSRKSSSGSSSTNCNASPKSSSPIYIKLPTGINELRERVQNLSSKLVTHDKTADNIISELKELKAEMEVMSDYHKAVEELNDIASGGRSRKNLVTEILDGDKERDELLKENQELQAYIKEQQDTIDKVMIAYREQVAKLESCNEMERQAILVMKQDLKAAVDEQKEEQADMKRVMEQAIEADEKSVGRFEDIVAKLQAENLAMRKILGQMPFEQFEGEEMQPLVQEILQDGGGEKVMAIATPTPPKEPTTPTRPAPNGDTSDSASDGDNSPNGPR